MHALTDTLRRIAADPIATADVWGPVVAPIVALVLLLACRQYLGAWPDLWRARRAVLPYVARFGAGEYPAVDDLTDVNLAEQVPEKTALPLQDRELVGTVDAPPAAVRDELRSIPRVYANTLASIQYDVLGGERVYEVGSYAYRPEGFLGLWQYHVRLTPTQDGRTRLWAHYERSAWRQPVRHYRGDGWDADEGVREMSSLFASDERFDASDRARALVGDE